MELRLKYSMVNSRLSQGLVQRNGLLLSLLLFGSLPVLVPYSSALRIIITNSDDLIC